MSLYNQYNAEPTWSETFRRFWPDTRTPRGARQALKLGCFAYNAMIVMQIAFGWHRPGAVPWLIVDVAFLAIVSVAVYKESVIAAVIGVAYAILAPILTLWSEPTGCVFLIVSLLVLVGALNGARGALAIRRERRQS